MKKILIIWLIITFGMIVLPSLKASAVSENFQQKILPLGCVFTIVNSGTGELYYVTPQACGVVEPQPVVSVSQQQPISASSKPNISGFVPNPSLPFGGQPKNGSFPLSNTKILSWTPIASVANPSASKNVGQKSFRLSAVAAVAAGGSLVIVIAVVIFLF